MSRPYSITFAEPLLLLAVAACRRLHRFHRRRRRIDHDPALLLTGFESIRCARNQQASGAVRPGSATNASLCAPRKVMDVREAAHRPIKRRRRCYLGALCSRPSCRATYCVRHAPFPAHRHRTLFRSQAEDGRCRPHGADNAVRVRADGGAADRFYDGLFGPGTGCSSCWPSSRLPATAC